MKILDHLTMITTILRSFISRGRDTSIRLCNKFEWPIFTCSRYAQRL